MARFDAPALLAAVDARQSPSNARIFHAKRTYFFAQGCMSFFIVTICVFVVGLIVVLLVTGALLTTPAENVPGDTSSPYGWTNDAFAVLMLLCFLAFVVVFVRRGVGAMRGLRTWRTQVLVLAPDGFVARTGMSPDALFAVSYADLAAIALSSWHARYETITNLVLTYRDATPPAADTAHLEPEQVVWRVDPRFDATDTIVQTILEDHARAIARRASAE
jgi:hypothetical protein